MKNSSLLALTSTFIFSLLLQVPALADKNDDANIPDIQSLPILKAGLAPGTIAIAFPDQLHPTQPQTGHRELTKYKIPAFKDLIKEDGKKFSKKMYAYAYNKSIVPVYLHAPLAGDSRQGAIKTLGFVTDRTHGSSAQSQVYKELYDKEGLRSLIFDEKNRPVNFILVKVMADNSDLSDSDFANYMSKNKHAYLKEWSRGDHGETLINDIAFLDLPEKVYKTSDNPYRSVVSELQHTKDKDGQPYLGRSNTDYAQFLDAEGLAKSNLVSWDEIAEDALPKVYENAIAAAIKFYQSKSAENLPGVVLNSKGAVCKKVLD